MNVFKNIDTPFSFIRPVITIGTFDGVHKGHQSILNHVKQEARKIQGETVVITFHPHPRLLLRPDDTTLQLITTLDEKLELLEYYGIQNVVVVPFTREFSNLSAEAYIRDFLVSTFKPNRIVIGYDHHFGKNRSGTIRMLEQFQFSYHYHLDEIPKQIVEDIDVSSTKIRKGIMHGQVDQVARLLGHPYSLKGLIKKGNQLGRTIGFPTANIQSSDELKLLPKIGVYAVWVQYKNDTYKGMMNIGTRPTVEGTTITAEVHIIDFDKDIYGEEIKVNFVKRIRDEIKFESLQALKEQIERDKKEVIQLLHI